MMYGPFFVFSRPKNMRAFGCKPIKKVSCDVSAVARDVTFMTGGLSS